MLNEAEVRKAYFAWNPKDDPNFAAQVIGEDTIGGKGRSLLYAINVLRNSQNPLLEGVKMAPSIFLGTDIFDKAASDVKNLSSMVGAGDLEGIEKGFLATTLPDYVTDGIRKYLVDMTDPVVVRSSSVQEDSLKHSFAGKYRSTFHLNEGSLEDRLTVVTDEIKRIYARIFYPAATSYREKHGLGGDKMGIIVMRMAGKRRGQYYYPTTGGVGYSRNMRRWTTRIRAQDGILRFVFGLGTMSTKRGYARNFSLSNPMLRPEGPIPYKIMKQAQETFQVLDLQTAQMTILDVKKIWKDLLKFHPNLGIFAQLFQPDGDTGYFTPIDFSTIIPDRFAKVCFTFEDFPRRHKNFFTRMNALLPLLESSMGVAADIEYAYEPKEDELELLQSRPLWLGGAAASEAMPDLTDKKIILKADRMVTDGYLKNVPYMMYIDHRIYSVEPDFHSVARAVGYINQTLAPNKYILAAPGRVGSSNPELGVPVQYNELTHCACIAELGIPKFGHMPELSYGTHFFSDLETDNVLYMPVYEGENNNIFDEAWYDENPYVEGAHPAIRLYKGDFSVYMDGSNNTGVVVVNRIDDDCQSF